MTPAEARGHEHFVDKNAASWAGQCSGWAYSALSKEVAAKVDVPGQEGQKGLWIGGEWMSRADLGNWAMALSTPMAARDENLVAGTRDNPRPGPVDLLKASAQFLTEGGGGFVADIAPGQEKWNQPFFGSEIASQSLTGRPANRLLQQAKEEGFPGATVKQVTITGKYGDELSAGLGAKGDAHEGPPAAGTRTWSMYAVLDDQGKVLTAYMADDKKVKDSGLPSMKTDPLPDYILKPTMRPMANALKGEEVEGAYGPQAQFFFGTVLQKGVPASTRAAFENEVSILPAGAVPAEQARVLAEKYPGMANAYAPEQWERLFERRGLGATAFGSIAERH